MGVVAGSGQALGSALPTPRANPKRFLGGKFPKGPVAATGRVIGANDRVLLGHVGLGGRGTSVMNTFTKNATDWNVRSIAVADLYSARLEKRKAELLGKDPETTSIQAEKDYRRLLDNKDLDGIVIATPEHWHCEIAVHALQAGKHVYCEKPMARYLDEGFQLYDTWKKSGKVVQIGSQGCSDQKYHRAREAITAGKLGPIVSAQSSYTRNSKDGEWNYKIDEDAGPHNIDWEAWLGSAPRRPWNEDSKARFFRYRKYRDYSAGILGDLMPHRIHPLLLALGGNSWPLKVHCVGTRLVSLDREVSDTTHVIAEMEGGWTYLFVGSTVNEQGVTEQVRGHQATLYLAGKDPEIKPERPFAEEVEASTLTIEKSGDDGPHQKNFIDCIRDGKLPNCNMELAMRTQTVISLAEISELSGKAVHFDPKKRTYKVA